MSFSYGRLLFRNVNYCSKQANGQKDNGNLFGKYAFGVLETIAFSIVTFC